MTSQPALFLETLENRYAPATLVSPTRLTYQDVDGDSVVLTVSKPILNAANKDSLFGFVGGSGVNGDNSVKQQLTKIDLTGLGSAANGLDITTQATRSAVNGGDGLAALGVIDATLIDLGKVTIDGDLAKIVAGDSTTATSGLKGLAAESLGRVLFASGAIFPDLNSVVQGKLETLKIKRDVFGASLDVQGGADGKIGSISIGGSLIGLDSPKSGFIRSSGDIGSVKIGGNVEGGSQAETGLLVSLGKMGSVQIGGSLQGGAGTSAGTIGSLKETGLVSIRGNIQGGTGSNSAGIFAIGRLAGVSVGGSVVGGEGGSSAQVAAFGQLGPVNVKGSVQGGTGNGSGLLGAQGDFTSVRIGGSLIGGSGNNTGLVFAKGNIGTVAIGGNLVGGSVGGSVDLSDSGEIQGKRIGSVTLGGSLIAGRKATTGLFKNNGAIRAADDIGSILINGSLIGNSSNFGLITARGQASPSATSDVAIGKLSVLGRVEFAQILAGYNLDLDPVNADAQIGAVSVGGDFSLSSIVAGAVTSNQFFGDADDAKMSGTGVKDVGGISSRIASVTVKGQVVGAGGIPGLHFGIVAENVGVIKAGNLILPTIVGNSNDDFFVGISGDFKVKEI